MFLLENSVIESDTLHLAAHILGLRSNESGQLEATCAQLTRSVYSFAVCVLQF